MLKRVKNLLCAQDGRLRVLALDVVCQAIRDLAGHESKSSLVCGFGVGHCSQGRKGWMQVSYCLCVGLVVGIVFSSGSGHCV